MKSKASHTLIPHSRPTLGKKEIGLVSEVISSGHIAQGEVVRRFEQSLSGYIGTQDAVACSSGTTALHLTLLAMEIGPGDEVILPSYVCSALLNAVRYVDATPVLAEVDPHTYNIDPQDAKRRLSTRTKAIIVPHLFGLAAELDSLISLGAPVIEDCAQAVGATYRGKKVGSIGHAAIFSFYATKVITTGEGGMVLSNSRGLLDRVRDLREYDQRRDPGVRYNYKMTDMQASMGLVQLGRLKEFVHRRKAIAHEYYKGFETFSVQVPARDHGHIYYRYVVKLGEDAEPHIEALAEKGIGCALPVYTPLHRYLKIKGYPKTEEVWRQSFSIPIYPSLTEGELNRVIESVADVLRRA
jgi:perosamine synthetase